MPQAPRIAEKAHYVRHAGHAPFLTQRMHGNVRRKCMRTFKKADDMYALEPCGKFLYPWWKNPRTGPAVSTACVTIRRRTPLEIAPALCAPEGPWGGLFLTGRMTMPYRRDFFPRLRAAGPYTPVRSSRSLRDSVRSAMFFSCAAWRS